jgi:thiamine-phosphate pyrophosphorylase
VTRLPDPCICLITDRRHLVPSARTSSEEIAALERWLEEALDLVDLIQIRESDLPASSLEPLVQRVSRRARSTRAQVVVNDRMDIALAAGADGVHLRADGPVPARARALAPPEWTIGRSVHSAREARTSEGADYLLFGTVFPSPSKASGGPTQGVGPLSEAVAAAAVPVLAIGGITIERAAAVRRAGAGGVAAITLFLPAGAAPGALGVRAAAAGLRAALSA